MTPRTSLSLGFALLIALLAAPAAAAAGPGEPPRTAAEANLGTLPTIMARFGTFHAGGTRIRAASAAYSRAEIAPVAELLGSLPHGPELSKLELYVATDAELTALCGAGNMACYDPASERMAVSGESTGVASISRRAVIAHEYGHHIANNRSGGIWSAFAAGTLRWSTYEQVCERKREGEAFPGNEGVRYWENPGEAFAQSYADLVYPEGTWYYSPLFRPDQKALEKLKEDVLHPLEPRRIVWRTGASEKRAVTLGEATVATAGAFVRTIPAPYDGRIKVRVHTGEKTRFRVSIVDPDSGALLVRSEAATKKLTVHYANCGYRRLQLVIDRLAPPTPLEVAVRLP